MYYLVLKCETNNSDHEEVDNEDCGRMSLPGDEEEYLEDLIQLIPSGDNEPEEEGYSYYKQKSYVPVTFFNNQRNMRLLSNCRPLRIELVDCKKENHLNNYNSNYSDVCAKESDILNEEAKYILDRIASNGLTIKCKTKNLHNKPTDKLNIAKKIKGINFKKNRGLIGMKVSQKIEILEIDSESEESQTNGESTNNDYDVSENNTEIKSVNEILDTTNNITELNKNDNNVYFTSKDQENSLVININSSLTAEKQIVHNNIVDETQIDLKTCDVIGKEKDKREKEDVKRRGEEREDMKNMQNRTEKTENNQLNKIVKEYSKQTIKGNNIVEITQNINRDVVAININEIEENKKVESNVNNSSSSPGLHSTLHINNKKIYKDRNDTPSQIQPKGVIDNRLKTMSPKNNNQKSHEPEKYTNECVSTKETITTVISKPEVTSNNQLATGLDEKLVKAQPVNTMSTILSPSNKTCESTAVNIHLADKNNLKTQPDRVNDKSAVTVVQSKSPNSEKIIRLKLDGNIYKDVFESRKNVTDSRVSVNIDNIASKLPFQTVRSANHNNGNKQSLHSFDIFSQNITENAPNLGPKYVPIYQKIGSAIIRQDVNSISPGVIDKRPKILSKTRIRPFTGSIESWKNMSNESSKPNNFDKNNDLAKKLGLPHPTGIEKKNTNATNRTPHSLELPKVNICTSALQSEAVVTGGNEINSQNSSKYENSNKILSHNSTRISNYRKSKMSPNNISSQQRQSYCFSSFGPQPRQYVRPLLRNDGTQVLSVRNFPKPYSNSINSTNSVPILNSELMHPNNFNNPNSTMYPGEYSNNYNAYWPYLYTRLPPPPPPPPPQPSVIVTNTSGPSELSQSYGIANKSDKSKANVIRHINIFARPASEKCHNNTNTRNIVDINNISPPKTRSNNIEISPTVVSSKSEMFEELEKEMMNIHHEDLEYFMNNELLDSRITESNNINISDPRKKNFANNKLTTNKKSDTKIQSEDKKAFKRPSDIKVSKDNVKKKKIPNSKSRKNFTLVEANKNLSQDLYSPPILPIPSYEKTLEILTRASNDALKHIEASSEVKEKSCEKLSNNMNVIDAKDKTKKISLDEYKNRGDQKQICERKKRKYERKESKFVKKCLETKNPDQDQGYDSDTTIIL